MELVFQPTTSYQNFTPDHWVPLIIISGIFAGLIALSGKYSSEIKFRMAFILSLIPLFCVICRMVFTAYEGIFSVQEELPFHLCRLIALVLPVFIWYRNEKWINSLYFLIIVGTLQAIITADLQYTYPHYSYILYWIFHVSLVWIPVFIIKNLKIRPEFSDLKRAFIAGNIYMLSTLVINFGIGANYFYTRHKPPGGSLLDFFGPWPVYLFVVEGLAIILLALAYLPFYKKENRQTTF